MAQHWQVWEQPLNDHAHIRSSLGRGNEHELLARVQPGADRVRGFLTKFLQLARINIELAHFTFRVAL